jgi:poly(3-hydroxybutyrate) depolymerase
MGVLAAQKPETKWATYTPLSAFESVNKNRRYPVVVAMHGGSDPIFIVESCNVAQVGAEEEFITVMPQTLTVEEFKRILNIMDSEGFPSDRSRVYGTGFSNDGRNQLLHW